MPDYRLYLRGKAGIVGRHDFEAGDSNEASTIAEQVFDACSDEANGWDVWCGTRLAADSARNGPRSPLVPLAELSAARQESIVRFEERIKSSEWAVARSRRLLERLAGLTHL